MSFKMTITRTLLDGTKEKVQIENSESIKDQGDLLDFLFPLISPKEIVTEEEKKPVPTPAQKVTKPVEVKKATPKVDSSPRTKQLPLTGSNATGFTIGEMLTQAALDAEKNEEIAPSPTQEKNGIGGICEIHCPECGHQTSKNVSPKSKYTLCPRCKKRLFLFATNKDNPGEPNAFGVSFEATRLYLTTQEKWEIKQLEREMSRE